jgi:2,4-dienoyl-CoA reductase-like NADH-dependent reductase (Old Yellow Enzyme family)
MNLTHILAPIRLVGCEIRNRIVRAAHTTYLDDGAINADLIAYHVARGNGGVGLSIMEVLGFILPRQRA